MNRFMIRIWFVTVATIVCGAILVSGCGTKITIPEATGLFSVSSYTLYDEFDDDDVRQLAISQGVIFVLEGDGLYKRDLEYGILSNVIGAEFNEPQSLCIDEGGQLVFVWNQGSKQVSWYSTSDLMLMGTSDLPAVQTAVAMETSSLGIEQVPGASSYLYLSDPETEVIHRYVFDEFNGLTPYGILARADGEAARFVHIAAGLARDIEDHLLVCDVDTNRNWVIRFDCTPDLNDLSLDPLEQDPLRGLAVMFTDPVCAIAAPKEFVLGDAADCNQVDWEGGPSSAFGEFDGPHFVTVDGSGRIFVSDTQNNRIQMFNREGGFELFFGNDEISPWPKSLAVVDVRVSGEEDGVNFAAFVYIVMPSEGKVKRFISSVHYTELTGELPPPPS